MVSPDCVVKIVHWKMDKRIGQKRNKGKVNCLNKRSDLWDLYRTTVGRNIWLGYYSRRRLSTPKVTVTKGLYIRWER